MMNGLIRLGMHSAPGAMTTPVESMSGLLDVSGSVDAFAEVLTGAIAGGESEDDGENGGDEGGFDSLSFEGVESEEDEIALLERDLSISLIFNNNIEISEVQVETPLLYSAADRTMPSGKTEVAGNVIEQPVELVQDTPLTRPVMATANSPDARIFDPRPGSVQRDPLDQIVDIGPAKEKTAPLPDKTMTATVPLPDGLERGPKPAPARESNMSPLPPVVQSNPMQSAPPSAAMPFIPAVTTAPQTMVSTSIPAPVLPPLDMQAGHQWIARLSHDIEQLSNENSVKPELNFQLKPEHLGKLSVRITEGAAGDVVRLETENENVKALLLGSQGRLEQDIRLSGLKLARVDVTVQDHSGSQLGQHSSGPREGGAETGRNGSAQSQASLAEQGAPAQNGADVVLPNGAHTASSRHGARYA